VALLLWALTTECKEIASWERAILALEKSKVEKLNRSVIQKHRSAFRKVTHFWAAWCDYKGAFPFDDPDQFFAKSETFLKDTKHHLGKDFGSSAYRRGGPTGFRVERQHDFDFSLVPAPRPRGRPRISRP
jgi:hypothetical protein